jgi:methionyl-tRNA formyltransferase
MIELILGAALAVATYVAIKQYQKYHSVSKALTAAEASLLAARLKVIAEVTQIETEAKAEEAVVEAKIKSIVTRVRAAL